MNSPLRLPLACAMLALAGAASADAWSVRYYTAVNFTGVGTATNLPAKVDFSFERLSIEPYRAISKHYRPDWFSFVARGRTAASQQAEFRVVRGQKDHADYRLRRTGALVELFAKFTGIGSHTVDFHVESREPGGEWKLFEPLAVDAATANREAVVFDREFSVVGARRRYAGFRYFTFDVPEDGCYEIRSIARDEPRVLKILLDDEMVLSWIMSGDGRASWRARFGEPDRTGRKDRPRYDFFGSLKTVRFLKKGRHHFDVQARRTPAVTTDDIETLPAVNLWRFGIRRLTGECPEDEFAFRLAESDGSTVFEKGETLKVEYVSAAKDYADDNTMSVRTIRGSNEVWTATKRLGRTGERFEYPCADEGGFEYLVRNSRGDVVDGPWAFAVADPTPLPWPKVGEKGAERPSVVVDRIDCTEGAGGPHEFRESGGSTVLTTDGGGVCRETGRVGRQQGFYRVSKDRERRWEADTNVTTLAQAMKLGGYHVTTKYDWFAYTLQVKHPGKPHLVRLRIPNDKERLVSAMAVDRVSRLYNGWNTWTGDAPAAGKDGWMAFNAWPNGDKLDVMVLSTMQPVPETRGKRKFAPSAVCEIELVAYPEGLPPLAEAACGWQDAHVFGWTGEQGDLWINERTMPSVASPGVYRSWADFCEIWDRFGECARSKGEGVQVMPAHTYGRLFVGGELARYFRPGTDHYREACANGEYCDLFDRDIFKLALIKGSHYGLKIMFQLFEMGDVDPEAWADYHGMSREEAKGFFLTLDATNKLYRAYHTRSLMMNPCHPLARRHFVGYYEALAKRYGKYPAFGGILTRHWWRGLTGLFEPTWQKAELGFDDYSVARFAADEKLDDLKPVGPDQAAFDARKKLIQEKYLDRWNAWRTRQVFTLYKEMAEAMRRYAPEAKIWGPLGGRPVDHPWNAYRVEMGLDNEVFKHHPELGYRTGLMDRNARKTAHVEINHFDANHYSNFAVHLPPVPLTVKNYPGNPVSRYGHEYCADGAYRISPYHLMEFAEALSTNNLNQMFGGCSWVLPAVDPLRDRFVQAFRAIPKGDFKPLVVREGDVALQLAKVGGETVFYVVNLRPEASAFTVAFDGRGTATDCVSGRVEKGVKGVSVECPPYCPAVWKVSGAQPVSVERKGK